MHPILYPFGSKERWLTYLNRWITSDAHQLSLCGSLLDKGMVPLTKGSELADYLGISPKLVTHMAKEPRRYYAKFFVLKKNGKPRQITAPRVFLKVVQRYILDCILSPIAPHPSAAGFV